MQVRLLSGSLNQIVLMTEVSKKIQKLAKAYGERVARHPDCPRNHGAHGNGIMLGEFDDSDLEIVAFFHELGHTKSPEVVKRGCVMCPLSGEGLAWEIGLGLAFDQGYQWAYNSKEMRWAREQLATYGAISSTG